MSDHKIFMQAALEEALKGLREGGIPIGSVLVKDGKIIGRGHNQRVQKKSAILHAEMDCLENAGRLKASDYQKCVIYSTLSPCSMCTGTILLYGAPRANARGTLKTRLHPSGFGRGPSYAEVRRHLAEAEDFISLSVPDLRPGSSA